MSPHDALAMPQDQYDGFARYIDHVRREQERRMRGR